jgi:alkylation response protein AidB-like acyl-CoA dehydrogenase
LRVVGALAEGDPNVAQIYLVHCFVAELLTDVAPRVVQRRLHTQTAAGELRWTNAFTDRPPGRSTLTPQCGGYRLDGRKFFATGSLGGDWLATIALLDGQPRVALLPVNTPGVTVLDDWDSMGQRATASGSVHFDGVAVSAEFVCPPPSGAPDRTLTLHGPLGAAAIHVGIAAGALRELATHVADSRADRPERAITFGRLQTLLDVSRLLVDRALDRLDDACACPSAARRAQASIAISQAKALSTDTGLQIATDALALAQTHDVRGRGLDRHWRNLRTLSLNEPLAYRWRLVGDYHLNRTLPPNTPFS